MNPALKQFIRSFKKNLTPECLVSINACLNCGKCGDACAWHLTSDDQKNHPLVRKSLLAAIYRRYHTIEGKLLGTIGTLPSPSVIDLEKGHGSFWECTLCGRCSMSCPLGLNNRALFKAARMAFSDAGLSHRHPVLKEIYENTRDKQHSFGLRREQIFLRVGFFLRYLGIDVAIDVPDQHYLFMCPAVGNTKIPDLGINLIKLLNAAEIPYTVSSRLVDTGTEIDHIVGNKELSRQMLINIEQEAERLNARALVVGECGCDMRTFFIECCGLLNRPLKYPVISVDELLLSAIEKRQLAVEPLDGSYTYHDPCYVERLSNMGKTSRELLSKVTKNIKEMTPNRKLNYCCNGGAGPMRLPEKRVKRLKTSALKAEQIRTSGAEVVVTPCAVCMLTLNDICESYHLKQSDRRMACLLFEIVYKAAAKAWKKSKKENIAKTPIAHLGKPESFIEKHSMRVIMDNLLNHPDFKIYLEWLKQDEITTRFLRRHPGAACVLNEIEKKNNHMMQGQKVSCSPGEKELLDRLSKKEELLN